MRFLLTVMFGLICHYTYGQQDTVFYNEKWKVIAKNDNPLYFRPYPVTDSGKYKVIDYYITGEVQMVGYYSLKANNIMGDDIGANKYMDGRFEYYYRNGKIKSAGFCRNGNNEGEWRYYYETNGNLKSIQYFINGNVEGQYVMYDSVHGRIVQKGVYKNDEAEGVWNYYYDNTGKKSSDLLFKAGKLHGKAIFYDSVDGKTIKLGELRNNKKVGKWISYYKSGNVMLVEPYKNGMLNGELIKYDSLGNVESITETKNNQLQGKRIYYYPASKKKWIEANYVNDTMHGELCSYYENGKPKRLEKFERGQQLAAQCFAENGEPVEYFPIFIDAEFGEDIMTYVGNNLHYPDDEKKSGKEGKVLVRFTITESGLVKNSEIIEGMGGAFDEEALRLVSQMPPWQPAYIDGIRQETTKTLPIVFWKQETTQVEEE